jgi:hypothetical protein
MKPSSESQNDKQLTRTNRIVAVILAVIWVGGGLAGLWVFLSDHSRLGIIISILTIVYGLLWVRVAYTGKRISWKLRRRS